MRNPEMARAITNCWISLVPSKMVWICVSDDDVRYLEELDTPVKDGDTESIIPAVAGGC